MRARRYASTRVITIALATALLSLAQSVPTSARQEGASVWYGTTTPLAIPDASSVDTLLYVDGVGSPILDVRVSLYLTHASAADLDISLVGPDGTTVDLTSDNGGAAPNFGSACRPEASRTTFDDAAATSIVDGAAPFVGSFRPEQSLEVFDGKSGMGAANGIWRLRVVDDTVGQVGTLQCWSLFITAAIAAPTSIDDAFAVAVNAPIVVPPPGVLSNDDTNDGGAMTAALVASPTHGFLQFNASGGFTYTPSQDYFGPDSFAYRATNAVGTGNVAWVNLTVGSPPTAVDDAYAGAFQSPLVVPAPGVLANDVNPLASSSMSAGLVTPPQHGTLTLGTTGGFTYVPDAGYLGPDVFRYRAINLSGPGNTASVILTVSPPTSVQPPTGLYVHAVLGNVVTLRWSAPEFGPAPTSYVLEGGVGQGSVQASIPTGNASPIFTFVAPSGSFFIRMHAVAGADRSGASNEVPLHVAVAVAPSAPASLLSLVNGRTLNLAWRNTFAGGPPARMVLTVAGTYTGSFALGPMDTFGFAGVPDGTYTLRVFAANDGGVSAASPPVTVTFPGPCSGPPLSPTGFLAYRVGRTVFTIWDPASEGPAPTAFVLLVSGGYTGNLPTEGRALSGTVGPGQYDLRVMATNACGSSAPAAVQTVIVP